MPVVFLFGRGAGPGFAGRPAAERTERTGDSMATWGIRGAIDVASNDRTEILEATRQLLERIVAENRLRGEEIVSVLFSTTADLDAAPPAEAARGMGWVQTPLLCVQEMAVRGGLPRCIRVLIHVAGDRPAGRIRHVYLGGARSLRPDWASEATR